MNSTNKLTKNDLNRNKIQKDTEKINPVYFRFLGFGVHFRITSLQLSLLELVGFEGFLPSKGAI